MKRIAILGGTFNPVHVGHLTIAQMVQEQLKLDKVIFVPANLPPHKGARHMISGEDRYQMVRLAIAGNPRFDASDFEIRREGKSYSIDTIQYFTGCYPLRTKFFFIVGSDLLAGLHTWKRVEDILKAVSFVVVRREGFEATQANVPFRMISIPGLQTSSTFVRQRIVAGKTVRYLVPDKVIAYIERKNLYRNNDPALAGK